MKFIHCLLIGGCVGFFMYEPMLKLKNSLVLYTPIPETKHVQKTVQQVAQNLSIKPNLKYIKTPEEKILPKLFIDEGFSKSERVKIQQGYQTIARIIYSSSLHNCVNLSSKITHSHQLTAGSAPSSYFFGPILKSRSHLAVKRINDDATNSSSDFGKTQSTSSPFGIYLSSAFVSNHSPNQISSTMLKEMVRALGFHYPPSKLQKQQGFSFASGDVFELEQCVKNHGKPSEDDMRIFYSKLQSGKTKKVSVSFQHVQSTHRPVVEVAKKMGSHQHNLPPLTPKNSLVVHKETRPKNHAPTPLPEKVGEIKIEPDYTLLDTPGDF
jgi:hypothetical protein